jgi:hypothetical protein
MNEAPLRVGDNTRPLPPLGGSDGAAALCDDCGCAEAGWSDCCCKRAFQKGRWDAERTASRFDLWQSWGCWRRTCTCRNIFCRRVSLAVWGGYGGRRPRGGGGRGRRRRWSSIAGQSVRFVGACSTQKARCLLGGGGCFACCYCRVFLSRSLEMIIVKNISGCCWLLLAAAGCCLLACCCWLLLACLLLLLLLPVVPRMSRMSCAASQQKLTDT